ncbi:MAG: UDP-N-acetylmuramoyl-tripeptide--D-alanyl-D-alanine ligase [Clostridia bacterium]|nr:UDP-N-acetylmuramoyl-tripeptide--D-alanyl-D-alanine ligase [Clostridia bacterium]
MISIKPRTASEIAEIVFGVLLGEDILIDRISLSSNEKMSEGCCFVAIKGEKYDGNDFIEDALKNGASLVICERKISCGACITVDNTRIALLKLASASKGDTKIIGITGSVGKTTVKNMIISVLSQKYKVTGTRENQNNEIGVALTMLGITNEDFCVVEMGMRALGEIDLLSSYALPETAVITNAKTSHIEMLGCEENILRAKLEILNYKPKYAILPNDKRLRASDFGDIRAIFVDERIDSSQYSYFQDGIEFCLDNYSKKMKIYSYSISNIYNARIAYYVGGLYGLTDEEICNGLARFKQDKMREEYLDINGVTVINDCYNSSYESMKSSLALLANYAKMNGKRANALIGDILELGACSKEIHTKIGILCREHKIERLFLLGENVKHIKNGAGYGEIYENNEELINELIEKLDKDDVLLVKASRRMKLENIIEGMKKRNE